MKTKKISIIEPVGGHGGMDYYDYGLGFGLGADFLDVLYFTCNETIDRNFEKVSLYKSFGNIWKGNRFKKGYYFIKGYLVSFLMSKKLKSEIFHFHFFNLGFLNLIVLLMAALFKQKKVVTLHDITPFHGKSNSLIEKLSMKLIDGIIIHNESSKNALLKRKLILPKIEVIAHGNYLPFVSFLPEPKAKKEINLLFFGQIKEVKGLEILLKALSMVIKKKTDYKLTIAGRPWKTDGDIYLRMISDLGLDNFVEKNFRFIKDSEVEHFYKQADVVVLPYKKIYQSGVLLLTLSYGRTVITSDLEPFKEIIVPDENGFMFKSENAEDLANCILKLKYENILETTINSRKLIKDKFDWTKIGRQTSGFYRSL